MIEFDPVLLTGVAEIDRQHRELFTRVGKLLEASHGGQSKEEVVRLLDFLEGYALEHFATEEQVMVDGGYPRLEGHRQEHRQFVRELRTLRYSIDADGPTRLFVMRVGSHVVEWLREHVYRTDKLLGEWLRDPARGST